MNTFKITKEDLSVEEAPSAVKLAQEIFRAEGSLCDDWEFEDNDGHLYIWLPKHGFIGGTQLKGVAAVVDYYNLSFYVSYDTEVQRMYVSIYGTRK